MSTRRLIACCHVLCACVQQAHPSTGQFTSSAPARSCRAARRGRAGRARPGSQHGGPAVAKGFRQAEPGSGVRSWVASERIPLNVVIVTLFRLSRSPPGDPPTSPGNPAHAAGAADRTATRGASSPDAGDRTPADDPCPPWGRHRPFADPTRDSPSASSSWHPRYRWMKISSRKHAILPIPSRHRSAYLTPKS
jgi:hypothetical protein